MYRKYSLKKKSKNVEKLDKFVFFGNKRSKLTTLLCVSLSSQGPPFSLLYINTFKISLTVFYEMNTYILTLI